MKVLAYLVAAVCLCFALGGSPAAAQPAGYDPTASSYLGGSAATDAVRGCAIQSDGTVVLAANISDATPGGLTPIILPPGTASSPGAVLRLSADGQTVLSVARVGTLVTDMAIDDNDNIYVALSTQGMVKLNPTATAVIWSKSVMTVDRVDAGPTGYSAALNVSGKWIRVYNSAGTELGSFTGYSQYTNDVCIDEASQTIVHLGFRNANCWDGQSVQPVQISYYRGQSYTGTVKYTGYDWDTDPESERFLNRSANNMADTRGYRCSIGRDGLLYLAFECAGGNHIFRWNPFDIMLPAQIVGGDQWHLFYNSAAEHKTFFGRYDPDTGAYVLGQQFCCRLTSGAANTARVNEGQIWADAQGRVYIGGTSAWGLPLPTHPAYSGTSGWLPPDTGTYLGGAWFLVMSQDLTTRLFCTRMSTSATTHAIAARILSGSDARIVWAGKTTSATELYLENPIQDTLQGTQDGWFAVIGPQGGDTTPPAAPTGLGAVPVSSSEIDLDWADNTEPDFASYNVYRSTSPGVAPVPGNLIASGVPTSDYADSGLDPSTTYYYVVTAVDTSENESAASNEASATTLPGGDTTPPAAPTNLTAVPISSTRIDLDWDDNTEPDFDSYNVYRSMTKGFTPGPSTLIATDVPASAYSDLTVSPNKRYYYRVTAVDTSENESEPSNEASAKTPR